MDYKEVIYSRHSVRRFTQEEIPQEVIDEIIEEAQSAPSNKNTKSSAFMIIREPDTLAAISEMRDSGSALIKNANAAIVVLGSEIKSPEMWVENASISATYLMLSATAHGLGSCWVQVRLRNRFKADTAANSPTAEGYLRTLLGIRDGMRVLCVVALGYEKTEE